MEGTAYGTERNWETESKSNRNREPKRGRGQNNNGMQPWHRTGKAWEKGAGGRSGCAGEPYFMHGGQRAGQPGTHGCINHENTDGGRQRQPGLCHNGA